MTDQQLHNWTSLFLRAAISTAFLSAVADRFGLWPTELSAWGNWESFRSYTAFLNPWASGGIVDFLAISATAMEVVLALMLLTGFKTKWAAVAAGGLMLFFAMAMTVTSGIKAPFDYSVFTASSAAFGLGIMKKETFWELDSLFKSR